MTSSRFASLGRCRYVSITTFRADGTPVPTAVWVAADGDALVIITGADSGKVRRIRSNPSVTLAPCDVRGRVKGEAVAGRAVIQDAAASDRTTALIRRKYGLLGWLFSRGDASERVGIEVRSA